MMALAISAVLSGTPRAWRPAGAFIVLVAVTLAQYGVDGLILATVLSGFILLAIGRSEVSGTDGFSST